MSETQMETEQELLGLANALYNLGTTVIADSTKDRLKQGTDANITEGKPVGQRVNGVIERLAAIEELSQKTTTLIPMQILQCAATFSMASIVCLITSCRDIDNSRNPMNLTKDRLERAATENQFMNGKIHALSVCSAITP